MGQSRGLNEGSRKREGIALPTAHCDIGEIS